MSWYSLFGTGALDVVQVEVPANAATVTASQGTTVLLLNQGSLLALLTVVFPSTPTDGQRFAISSATIITVLSMTGGTIKNPLTSISLNGFARYIYNTATNAWWRVG